MQPQSILSYDGEKSVLFVLTLKNIVLKILTLGFYGFWGETALRKYFAASLSIASDRFEYTGSGRELLLGLAKGISLWGMILLLFKIVHVGSAYFHLEFVGFAMSFLIPSTYSILIDKTRYQVWQYRLSRITWRGMHFYLSGSSWKYAERTFKAWSSSIISLGLKSPSIVTQHYIWVCSHLHLGNAQAEFHGDPKTLRKVNLITLLLFLPTFGLSRFWYRIAKIRYFVTGLRIAGCSFVLNFTVGQYIYLMLGNALWLILSLGLGFAMTVQRKAQFVAKNLGILGDLNKLSLEQAQWQMAHSGEGFATVLGSDTSFFN